MDTLDMHCKRIVLPRSELFDYFKNKYVTRLWNYDNSISAIRLQCIVLFHLLILLRCLLLVCLY